MKIAILSDVHDLYSDDDRIKLCIVSIKRNWCEHIIHLWDHWRPSHSLKPFFETGLPISAIRWNTDGEKRWIMKLYESRDDCEIARTTYGTYEIWWRKFFLTHFPNIFKYVADSWDFDVVAYWHSHVRNEELIWETLTINPWSIIGDKESPSYAIYDTDTHTVEFIELT